MSAILEIRDGEPAWLSQDIWVVPGLDPAGPPGQAEAGKPCYVWARARNTGQSPANNAEVRFYWTNPAVGIYRRNLQLIGAAFTNLDIGEVREVLCLAAWRPEIVNGGHECLVAEILHPDDPLPSPLPDAVDPQRYHQVAQRNISVLDLNMRRAAQPVHVAAAPRQDREALLRLEFGATLPPNLRGALGLGELSPAVLADVGLSPDPILDDDNARLDRRELRLTVPAGASACAYVLMRARPGVAAGYQVVDVVDRGGTGGLTLVIVNRPVARSAR